MERILPARKDRPVSFALPPITSARDAADISAAVMDAVSNGAISLNEAAEFAKLIDVYVKAYQVAELDDRAKPVEQLTTAELMRIAAGGRDSLDRPASKLLLLNSR
jgi:beta-lactamase class A